LTFEVDFDKINGMEIVPYIKKYSLAISELSQEIFEDASMVSGFYSPDNISLIGIENNRVIGLIGAMPQYSKTGWEMHPLGVHKEYRGRGYGAALVAALEQEVVKRGGVMVYLGSDDENGTTSLYGVDLYEDTYGKIASIKNTGGHPYTFYEKQGYKIVGVFPDANGIGKPDIWMAKRIKA